MYNKVNFIFSKLLKLKFRSPILKSVRFSSTSCAENDESHRDQNYSHTPVMVQEIIENMSPRDNETYLDMTFGAGGHSRELLDAASIKLYCLDRDPVAYNKAVALAEEYKPRVIPILGRFSELETLLKQHNVKKNTLDGILIDAGCSSMQLDDPLRGFSINKNGPLDMRMDGNRYESQPTASEVLDNLSVYDVTKIFKVYGEEKHAKKIAQALFDAKYMMKSIETTHELADLVYNIIGYEQRTDKLQRPTHCATKVFQALRIFVNNELNELNYAIEMAYAYLKVGGRLAVLSFHSLEDRIIKRQIQGIDMDEPISQSMSQKYKNCLTWHVTDDFTKVFLNRWTSMYKSVITPSPEEIETNPRSRSAKLRVAIKNPESEETS